MNELKSKLDTTILISKFVRDTLRNQKLKIHRKNLQDVTETWDHLLLRYDESVKLLKEIKEMDIFRDILEINIQIPSIKELYLKLYENEF